MAVILRSRTPGEQVVAAEDFRSTEKRLSHGGGSDPTPGYVGLFLPLGNAVGHRLYSNGRTRVSMISVVRRVLIHAKKKLVLPFLGAER